MSARDIKHGRRESGANTKLGIRGSVETGNAGSKVTRGFYRGATGLAATLLRPGLFVQREGRPTCVRCPVFRRGGVAETPLGVAVGRVAPFETVFRLGQLLVRVVERPRDQREHQLDVLPRPGRDLDVVLEQET